MSLDPDRALQAAVLTRLRADASLTALLAGRIYLRASFADVFRASDWRSTYGVLRLRAVTEPIGA